MLFPLSTCRTGYWTLSNLTNTTRDTQPVVLFGLASPMSLRNITKSRRTCWTHRPPSFELSGKHRSQAYRRAGRYNHSFALVPCRPHSTSVRITCFVPKTHQIIHEVLDARPRPGIPSLKPQTQDVVIGRVKISNLTILRSPLVMGSTSIYTRIKSEQTFCIQTRFPLTCAVLFLLYGVAPFQQTKAPRPVPLLDYTRWKLPVG